MEKKNKIFYKCYKYKIQKKILKPLLFYHVPKCGGTTLTVIISHLFKTQYRVLGPLFKNNDKGGMIAYKLFIENLKNINSSDINFLYGHLPFEIQNFLSNNFLLVTTLRDPIERSISHYKWMLVRGFCKKEDSLEEIFNNNKMSKNTIVNQFSGIGMNEQNTENSLELAYQNLSKKINLVYDSNNLFELLKFIISNYNLPNLFFQNYQVLQNDKIVISKKTIEIIEENNKLDIRLYKKLKQNNIFQKKILNQKKISDKKYFFSSPQFKLNGKSSINIDESSLLSLEKELISKNFSIKIK